MIGFLMLAAQAVLPPGEAFQSPALRWTCEMVDPQFSRSMVSGAFDPISGYEQSPALILSDTANLLSGEGKVGMLSPGGNGTGNFYVVIAEKEGVYHHLDFRMNGEHHMGSLRIDTHSSDGSGGYVIGATRIGFCSISINTQASQR